MLQAHESCRYEIHIFTLLFFTLYSHIKCYRKKSTYFSRSPYCFCFVKKLS